MDMACLEQAIATLVRSVEDRDLNYVIGIPEGGPFSLPHTGRQMLHFWSFRKSTMTLSVPAISTGFSPATGS